MELKNFEENGDDGEVWFGNDVQKKSVEYLMKKYDIANLKGEDQPSVLDVGTGNGAFLFKLAKKGFRRLKGIDYSDYSIKLAKTIQEVANAENDGAFSKIEFLFQDAFALIDENAYDVIHDKGTFDVVFMNEELDNKAYARAINHRLKKETGIFIITSCNCTSSELDEIFLRDSDGRQLFTLVEEIKGYK